jgi:hypothetical protein
VKEWRPQPYDLVGPGRELREAVQDSLLRPGATVAQRAKWLKVGERHVENAAAGNMIPRWAKAQMMKGFRLGGYVRKARGS